MLRSQLARIRPHRDLPLSGTVEYDHTVIYCWQRLAELKSLEIQIMQLIRMRMRLVA